MTAANTRPERPLLAFVNTAIDELQRSLGLADSEFFCECGSNMCDERIKLTRAEYARLLEASEPVIVEAHGNSRASAVPETGDEGNFGPPQPDRGGTGLPASVGVTSTHLHRA